MNRLQELAEQLKPRVRGWRSLGTRPSNGEDMCAGCWDRSEHDIGADHDIPKGEPVFYSPEHPEYGDCDAYCIACVVDDAEAHEIIDMELAAALKQEVAQQRAAGGDDAN